MMSDTRIECQDASSQGKACRCWSNEPNVRTDKSRGYCLAMICADFLAGANLHNGNPEILLHSIRQFFKFLPGEQRQAFLAQAHQKAS